MNHILSLAGGVSGASVVAAPIEANPWVPAILWFGLNLLVLLVFLVLGVTLMVLGIRALLKYLRN